MSKNKTLWTREDTAKKNHIKKKRIIFMSNFSLFGATGHGTSFRASYSRCTGRPITLKYEPTMFDIPM